MNSQSGLLWDTVISLNQRGTHHLPTPKLALSRDPGAMQAVWGPQWNVWTSKPRHVATIDTILVSQKLSVFICKMGLTMPLW